MPILKITSGSNGPSVSTACVVCLKDSVVDANALVLGTVHQAGVIALPPCSCGAQEFLQRTTDVHPVESQAGHRKTVNALAEHLKANGLVHPEHTNEVAAMTTPPQCGGLIGVVPDSSLPSAIVRKRRAASAQTQAPDAVAAAKAVLEAAKVAYAKAVGATGGAAS